MKKVEKQERKTTLKELIEENLRSFKEYDFIRLFLATLRLNDTISFRLEELKYDLYPFRENPKFWILFQDVAVKETIEGNYVDIEQVIKEAGFYGLVFPNLSKVETIISMDLEYAHHVIKSYPSIYIEKMEELVHLYLEKDVQRKKQRI